MIQVRKADNRGKTNLGWLQSYHTFSFDTFYDPNNMHFRHLRVINDDYIAPSGGFGTHPHNDMEIITYITSGQIEHKDSLGNGSVIQSGEIQKMTAGSGIMHSEFNPSKTEDVHLYQIWIYPDKKELKPSYEQITFDKSMAVNGFLLLASNKQVKNTVHINQDVSLYLSLLQKEAETEFLMNTDRNVWIQVVKGELELNSQSISIGDGVAISNETLLQFKGVQEAEILLFDLN